MDGSLYAKTKSIRLSVLIQYWRLTDEQSVGRLEVIPVTYYMFTTFNTPYLATNQRTDSRHFRPRVVLFLERACRFYLYED